jgi:hypothetical protein
LFPEIQNPDGLTLNLERSLSPPSCYLAILNKSSFERLLEPPINADKGRFQNQMAPLRIEALPHFEGFFPTAKAQSARRKTWGQGKPLSKSFFCFHLCALCAFAFEKSFLMGSGPLMPGTAFLLSLNRK